MGFFSTGRSKAKRQARQARASMAKMRRQYNKLAKHYRSTVKSFQRRAKESHANYEASLTRLQSESQQALADLGASHQAQIRRNAKRRKMEMAAQKGKDVRKSKAIRSKYAKESIGTRNVSGASSRSAKGSISSPRLKSKKRRPVSSSRARRPGTKMRRPRPR